MVVVVVVGVVAVVVAAFVFVFVDVGVFVLVDVAVGVVTGLLQTVMPTVDPLVTVVPPGGVWADTLSTVVGEHVAVVAGAAFNPLPASVVTACVSVSPSTFGTTTVHGPLETVSLTFVPGATRVPAFGVWAMTMPVPYWLEHPELTAPAASPVTPRVLPAFALVSPTTFGTITELRVETVSEMLCPLLTSCPAGGV